MALLHRRSPAPIHSEYTKYKPYLREDFVYRCVYCTIHENEHAGPRHFHVEHFRPLKHFPALINDYSNLLYGCDICNPFKNDDWPSDTPIVDGKGYLDPCEHDYDEHFSLIETTLEGKTVVAQYMIEKLHLNREQLKKLREKRQKDQDQHIQILAEYEQQLTYITEILSDPDIFIHHKKHLQETQIFLKTQYNTKKEGWSKRWQPKLQLEDYR